MERSSLSKYYTQVAKCLRLILNDLKPAASEKIPAEIQPSKSAELSTVLIAENNFSIDC